MRDFRKLNIWIKSHNLVLEVYKLTKVFPQEEKFGLISQIQRACVSIPANISEGCGRKSNADFSRFLIMAFGSASETEYFLILSKDLGYISIEQYNELENLVFEIKKMISSFLNKLKADN